MADSTITALPAASTLDGTETYPADQAGTTVKVTGSNLLRILVNAQTGTTYTIVAGDRSKLVTISNAGAVAVTLPQASATFPAGWYCYIENRGAGTVTITPTTSTIDGAASLALLTNAGATIASDGTNYFSLRGSGAVGAAGGTSVSKSQEFTASGTFTPATGVTGVRVTIVGAGGGGAGKGNSSASPGGGGGGAGEAVVGMPWVVVPAVGITVTIGAKGTGGNASGANTTAGTAGGDTSFGSVLIARGGKAGDATGASGAGSGINGAVSKAVDVVGGVGTAESAVHFGGSSGGGGGSTTTSPGAAGGGSGPYLGAAGGATNGSRAGGGGGASTTYGNGGVGGAGGSGGTNSAAGSYGGGGGGAGAVTANVASVGGSGTDGYCLVEWIA